MEQKKYKRADYSTRSRQYNRYNSTSEAHDYAPDIDYNPRKKPKRKVRTERDVKYVAVEQDEKTISIWFVIGVAILSGLAVSIVLIEAKIIEKRFYIGDLNVEVKLVTDDNTNLENELAKNLDLEYIEKVATEQLAMQKPASHQIIYIEVPKESYAEANTYQSTQKSFLQRLFSK